MFLLNFCVHSAHLKIGTESHPGNKPEAVPKNFVCQYSNGLQAFKIQPPHIQQSYVISAYKYSIKQSSTYSI